MSNEKEIKFSGVHESILTASVYNYNRAHIYHNLGPRRTIGYNPPTDKQEHPYYTYEEIDIMNFMIRVFDDGFPLMDKYYNLSNILKELFTDKKTEYKPIYLKNTWSNKDNKLLPYDYKT